MTSVVLRGILAAGVLVWMLYQLARRPHDRRLRAITALIACWAASWPFGVIGGGGLAFVGMDAMTGRAVEHMLLDAAAYCLVLFFLYSALPPRQASRSASRLAIPLILAVVVMAVATAAIPAGLRDQAAALTSGGVSDGPVGVASIGIFYTTANLYMGLAFGSAWLWAHRHRTNAQHPLRRGLLIAEVGLTCITAGTGLLVAANVIRWIGSPPPEWVTGAGIILLLPGLVLFLIGLAYPGITMRRQAFRIWRHHRRDYRALRPLWTTLHEHFPEDALDPTILPSWRERLALRGVHRRYYRRWAECRDGLLRVSPYLLALDVNAGDATAGNVREALAARASGQPIAHRATLVADPTEQGLHHDVDSLVDISRALHGS